MQEPKAMDNERDELLLQRILLEIQLSRSDVNARLDGTNARLDETNSRLDETNSRLDETNSRLDETNSRLDETNSRLDETNVRLGRLEAQRVEDQRRTKESFLQVLALIEILHRAQESLSKRMDRA